MSTNKEHRLASHSSNMVAPREFTTEDNNEWTVVQSKRALRKLRKEKKNKTYKASNKNKTTKSFFHDSSSDSSFTMSTAKSGTSWSDILKRALKMDRTEKNDPNYGTPTVPPRNIITNIKIEDDISSVGSSVSDQDDQIKNNNNTSPINIIITKNTKKNKSSKKTVPSSTEKRQYETAFSASQSQSKLSKVSGPKHKKKYKTNPTPDSVIQPHTDEAQDQLHRHKIHEEIVDNHYEYHKNIKDQEQHQETYLINQEQRENKHNMSPNDYGDYIKKYLPIFRTVQYPVSKRLISYELQELNKETNPDWGDFSLNRKHELRRLERTMIHNQLKINNFSHAWKHVYQDVNEYCTEFGIPNDYRVKLFVKELEYLSLYVHDVLPINYQE